MLTHVSVFRLQVDMKRLLKLASFGLLIHGPTGTHNPSSSSDVLCMSLLKFHDLGSDAGVCRWRV